MSLGASFKNISPR